MSLHNRAAVTRLLLELKPSGEQIGGALNYIIFKCIYIKKPLYLDYTPGGCNHTVATANPWIDTLAYSYVVQGLC